MRGKRKGRACLIISIRITPAGAGKTGFALKNIFADWDHPRRCGENSSASAFRFCGLGSPPQVRGKLIDCVGVTGSRQDHPRRCGENEWVVLHLTLKVRITPAGAGKTELMQRALSANGDHPRRCGENHRRKSVLNTMIGSPPQVRGKQCICYDGADYTRITPAGAGKTLQIRVCQRIF